jgi:phosphate transport system substrate-binding protein
MKLLVSLAGAGAIGICIASCAAPSQGVGPVPTTANANRVAASTHHRPKASSVTALLAAGGTLAAFVYYDLSNAYLEPNSGSTATPNPNGLTSTELLYAAVGTGSGQSSFLAHSGQGTVGSGEPPDTDTTRFPSITYPYTDIHWAGGDAPLSNTTLASYASSDEAIYGAADVIPLASTSVAVAYNPTDTGLKSTTKLKLSTAELCGIFTGTITNWDQLTQTGTKFANEPITVVVRSDGSGTTFLFSNSLNAQCSTFNSVTGGVGLGAASSQAPVWPASFVAEKGSGGIQGEVESKDGSIGYLSPSYTNLFTPAPAPSAALVENAKGNYEQPTIAGTTAGIKGPYESTGPCGTFMGTTTCYPNPVANQYLYVDNPSTASGAYPIVGFTFGYFYQCSDVANTTTALVGTKGWLTNFVLKLESGGALTPADTIVQADGLVQLTNTIKSNDVKIIKTGTNHIVTGPVSGVCTK